MKGFRVLCLAVATAEILIVAVILWNNALRRQEPARLATDAVLEEADLVRWQEELLAGQSDQDRSEESGEYGMEEWQTAAEETGESQGESVAEEEQYETVQTNDLLMRVKLKTSDYLSCEHEQVIISCSGTFRLTCQGKEQIYTGGQTVTITLQHPFFQYGSIVVSSEGEALVIDSIRHRGASHDYEGTLELYPGETGIVIINQLPLESYVSRVVPSEMPSAYGLEAAKLQAVCARTYAYERILNQKFIDQYGAYVDDYVDYQVYNSAGYQEVSSEATRQTEGIVMCYEGVPIIPYYFSTSCGYTSDNLAWSEAAEALPYLKSLNLTGREDIDLTQEETVSAFLQDWNAEGLESSMAWYRWKCEITLADLVPILNVRIRRLYEESRDRVQVEGDSLDSVLGSDFQSLSVSGRCEGGMVSEIAVAYAGGCIRVSGELNIRTLLGEPTMSYFNKSQAGTALSEGDYLPSAFFCLVPTEQEGALYSYVICGGGNGHGIGLSQNAAYVMLEQGSTWQEVLSFFYQGIAFSQIK